MSEASISSEISSDLRPVPCILMRGGTSRGPFFLASDLPAEPGARDRLLLAAMGSPDRRQIDGLGGAHPLTSKAGIVRRSTTPGVDLDFLFAQLQPDRDTVDLTPNCGNMLAAVLPFALERGLLAPGDGTTTARILTLNTNMQCDVTVQTPGGRLQYRGDARIDGVPGGAAPITINFLDTAGSVCPALLPSGRVLDEIQVDAAEAYTVQATMIDNGMPIRRGGAESVEVIMWMAMRGALTEKINCVHQNHYLATTTNMAVAVYEQVEASGPPAAPLKARSNEPLAGIEAIGGAYAFDVEHSVKALRLNRFFWRHREPAFRELVTRDIEAAFDELGLGIEERDLVRRQDWLGLVRYGVSFFVLEKFARVQKMSNLQVYARMRGETLEAFLKTRRVPESA
jgi:hypothetical protein